MPDLDRTRVTLGGAIYVFVLVGALLGAMFTFAALRDAVARMTERAMAEAVTVRSSGLQEALSRELSQEWNRLEALAELIARSDSTELQYAFDLSASEGGKVSWAGFATIDGTVQRASAQMLEGVSVAERPWFQRGLDGPFAGDVHEAVLLARLLDPSGEEPPRFLDFSLPVDAPDGRRLGVVGLHINFDWAAELVAETAAALEIEALILSQDGQIIISTLDDDPAQPTIEPFRLAALGTTSATLAPWPDGGSYYSVVQPILASDQTPNFGWRLIARVDQSAFAGIRQGLASELLPFIAGLVCVLAIATVLFVRLFANPFSAAAANAQAISEGRDIFPFESHRTRELALLSAAIAGLQAAKPAAPNAAAPRKTGDATDPPTAHPRAP